MDNYRAERNQILAEHMIKNLKSRNMAGYYAKTKEEALKMALEMMPEGSSVGWGGSASVTEIGLKQAVCEGNYQVINRDVCKTPEEKRQAELKEELEVVVGLVERCVAENARTALDQDEYTERYNGLVSRYETVKTRFDEVTQAIADKADRKKLLEQFLHTVETQEPVTQFDERLWSSLVDFVTVYSEKDIRVTFKDGTEIQV